MVYTSGLSTATPDEAIELMTMDVDDLINGITSNDSEHPCSNGHFTTSKETFQTGLERRKVQTIVFYTK